MRWIIFNIQDFRIIFDPNSLAFFWNYDTKVTPASKIFLKFNLKFITKLYNKWNFGGLLKHNFGYETQEPFCYKNRHFCNDIKYKITCFLWFKNFLKILRKQKVFYQWLLIRPQRGKTIWRYFHFILSWSTQKIWKSIK